jgi:hypothetical protein
VGVIGDGLKLTKRYDKCMTILLDEFPTVTVTIKPKVEDTMEIVKMTFDEAIDICQKKILEPPFTKESMEAWTRVSALCYAMKEILPNFMRNIDNILSNTVLGG